MKVCYCDESGTGDEPIAVMVAVVVDSQRMHVTKEHWEHLLKQLSGITGRALKEIHTRDFYSGNGPFRSLTQRLQGAPKGFSALAWNAQGTALASAGRQGEYWCVGQPCEVKDLDRDGVIASAVDQAMHN